MQLMTKWLPMICALFLLFSCSADNTKNENVENEKIQEKKEHAETLIDTKRGIDERGAFYELINQIKDEPFLSISESDNSPVTMTINSYPNEETPDSFTSQFETEGLTIRMLTSSSKMTLEEYIDKNKVETEPLDEFTTDSLQGQIYKYEEDDFEIIAEHNDHLHHIIIQTEEPIEDDDKIHNILQLIVKSIRTENEDAYNPLYDRFDLDLEKIKFPTLNEDRAELFSIGMISSVSNAINNELRAIYKIDDISYTFIISKQAKSISENDQYKETELETSAGIQVKKYVEIDEVSNAKETAFTWEDNHYYYELVDQLGENKLSDYEAIAFIESTINDERTFEQTDFFNNLNNDFSLTKDEEELIEVLEEFAP